MKVKSFADARDFLSNTQAELEVNEAANSLMLGVCLRLTRHPERVQTPPCLKTVEDEADLVLACMMTPPHKLVVYGHQGDLDEGALFADLSNAPANRVYRRIGYRPTCDYHEYVFLDRE